METVFVVVMVVRVSKLGVFSQYSLLAKSIIRVRSQRTLLPRRGKGRKDVCKDKLCLLPSHEILRGTVSVPRGVDSSTSQKGVIT